jgi:hypothetical protein
MSATIMKLISAYDWAARDALWVHSGQTDGAKSGWLVAQPVLWVGRILSTIG